MEDEKPILEKANAQGSITVADDHNVPGSGEMEIDRIKTMGTAFREMESRVHNSLIAAVFIDLIIFILLIYGIMKGKQYWILVSATGLVLVFIPIMLSLKLHIRLPVGFEALWGLAFLAHQCGLVLDLYAEYPKWDMVTHFLSSLVIGYSFFCVFHLSDRLIPGHNHHRYFLAMLTVFATISIGVFWEFAEHLEEVFFGASNQPSVADTMQDLFLDTMGGLIIALVLGRKITGNENPWIERTERDLIVFLLKKGILDQEDVPANFHHTLPKS